jgi:hypothetical protein
MAHQIYEISVNIMAEAIIDQLPKPRMPTIGNLMVCVQGYIMLGLERMRSC